MQIKNGIVQGTLRVLNKLISNHIQTNTIQTTSIVGNHVGNFGVCYTERDILEKTVEISGWEYVQGAHAYIQFTMGLPNSDITLSINSGAARPVSINGTDGLYSMNGVAWNGAIFDFVFDGETFVVIGLCPDNANHAYLAEEANFARYDVNGNSIETTYANKISSDTQTFKGSIVSTTEISSPNANFADVTADRLIDLNNANSTINVSDIFSGIETIGAKATTSSSPRQVGTWWTGDSIYRADFAVFVDVNSQQYKDGTLWYSEIVDDIAAAGLCGYTIVDVHAFGHIWWTNQDDIYYTDDVDVVNITCTGNQINFNPTELTNAAPDGLTIHGYIEYTKVGSLTENNITKTFS